MTQPKFLDQEPQESIAGFREKLTAITEQNPELESEINAVIGSSNELMESINIRRQTAAAELDMWQ